MMSVDIERWERRWRVQQATFYLPRPVLATHSTPNKNAIEILQKGSITAEVGAEGVSMSMDAFTWARLPRDSIFVFNLADLMFQVNLIPNFYLIPEVVAAEYSPSRKFKINGWPMIPYAEINTYQDVPLEHLKYVVSHSAEVSDLARRKGFLVESIVESTPFSKTIRDWEKLVYRCVFAVGPPTPIPCDDIRSFLFSYNQMVADLFKVNLREVNNFAKAYCVRYGLPVWWEP